MGGRFGSLVLSPAPFETARARTLAYGMLVLFFLALGQLDQAHRQEPFPDARVYQCVGLALHAGENPYGDLRMVCPTMDMHLLYPPLLTHVFGWSVSVAEQHWLDAYLIPYSLAMGLLVYLSWRLLPVRYQSLAGLAGAGAFYFLICGGVNISSWRTGNIALPLWSLLALSLLVWPSRIGTMLAAVCNGAVKFHLSYLLVVPLILQRAPLIAVGGGVMILAVYLLAPLLSPALFNLYIEQMRVEGQALRAVGSSTLLLSRWLTQAWTEHVVARVAVVVLVGVALLWRGRHLAWMLFQGGRTSATDQRATVALPPLTALFLLWVIVLSPKLSPYDLYLLGPIAVVLLQVPLHRRLLLTVLALPWLLRLGLEFLKGSPESLDRLYDATAIGYSQLHFAFVMAIWMGLCVYVWRMLDRDKLINLQAIQAARAAPC